MTEIQVLSDPALARLACDTIRFLAVDAVERAKSGHPGTPMGMADVAFVLWTRFLRYRPEDPQWIDRDRFVGDVNGGGPELRVTTHNGSVRLHRS